MPSKVKTSAEVKAVADKQKTKTMKSSTQVKSGAKSESRQASMSVPVFGLTGAKKGTVELPKEIFGAKVNEKLMAQAVRVYLTNQRQGTASTKSRGEVNKTKAKWYRQKGTGRARHGAKSAPIFVGGGVAMGPRPHAYELKMSKQMRRKSLASALSLKLSQEKVFVVDPKDAKGKTSEVFKMFAAMNLINKKGNKILFVGSNGELKRASRNIEGVDIYDVSGINTYVVLNSNNLVIVKEALAEFGKKDGKEVATA